MWNKFSKYRKLPLDERRLLRQAIWLIFPIRFYLLILPFARISSSFKAIEFPDQQAEAGLAEALEKTLRRIPAFVSGKNRCLVLSLTARQILNERKQASTIYLGLKLSPEKKLLAHAWIETNGCPVVANRDQFTVLHQF